MKYITLLAVMCVTMILSAKTLEEVQSEYTDGTTVYSFRYQGTGSERVRWDTVKTAKGAITLKKVSEPYKYDPVEDRDYKRLSENGTVISVTTNSHNKVTYVYKTKDSDKAEIFVKYLKKQSVVHAPNHVVKSAANPKAKLLSTEPEITKKMPWEYTKDDIKSYTDVLDNPVVSAKLLKVSDDTNVISKIDKIKEMKAKRELEKAGGYYIMIDSEKISYRDALNYGWADYPSTDLQMKIFIEVTSDPDSIWTKRVMFEQYPEAIKNTYKAHAESVRMIID